MAQSADAQMDTHEIEVNTGKRFAFGLNWQKYLVDLSEMEIANASASLLANLGVESLRGKTFLDVGSGSGLSSLAAHRAGARVVSFDFDPRSVACTTELRARSGATDSEWRVLRGSILDPPFLVSLGQFDVVYSWGVLHHTGAMWPALDHTLALVGARGQLYIALYNDQGVVSCYWTMVKKIYNRSRIGAFTMLTMHAPYFAAARVFGNLVRAVRGTPRDERGMKFWRDVVDWVGGYPFEVAGLQEVATYLEGNKFALERVRSVGRRSGCNEWVARRVN